VKRIRHLVGLKEGKTEKLFHRCCGQRFILFDTERRRAMTGLRRDHDARPTARDDVAKLLKHQRRPIEIDFEDCRR